MFLLSSSTLYAPPYSLFPSTSSNLLNSPHSLTFLHLYNSSNTLHPLYLLIHFLVSTFSASSSLNRGSGVTTLYG
ncbi:hypothetical protein RJT34_26209 [Clitoria ternatea]|uniref:Uncharacterized protein n=1 Tax=Clitoria ternatea TaxID=43366 RepID=A0AAN9I904_CLITE